MIMDDLTTTYEDQEIQISNRNAAFNPAVLPLKSKSTRMRGRPISQLWSYITDDPDPASKSSCTCKHCQLVINHYRKTDTIRAHLSKCDAFKRSISHLEKKDRPIWTLNKTDDKGKKTQQDPLLDRTESISSILSDSSRSLEVKSQDNSPKQAEMNRKRKTRDQYSQEVIPMAVYPLVNYNKAFDTDSPDTLPSLTNATVHPRWVFSK